mgnify:CR=1 FL=1
MPLAEIKTALITGKLLHVISGAVVGAFYRATGLTKEELEDRKKILLPCALSIPIVFTIKELMLSYGIAELGDWSTISLTALVSYFGYEILNVIKKRFPKMLDRGADRIDKTIGGDTVE